MGESHTSGIYLHVRGMYTTVTQNRKFACNKVS